MSLETLRRDGTPVATPVWFACLDGGYYVFSAGNAGKVKRLRHTSRVRIAVCDLRGRLKGPWLTTTAALLDDPTTERRAYAALLDKYGWQLRIATWLAQLTGKIHRRQYIRIERPDR